MYGLVLKKQTKNLKSSKFIIISILRYQFMFLLFFLHMEISELSFGSPQKSILSSSQYLLPIFFLTMMLKT